MENWKVIVSVNDNKKKKTIFVKAITMEEAYNEAKRYFLIERPEIDFCGVDTAIKI